jgi:hypothetical protein
MAQMIMRNFIVELPHNQGILVQGWVFPPHERIICMKCSQLDGTWMRDEAGSIAI